MTTVSQNYNSFTCSAISMQCVVDIIIFIRCNVKHDDVTLYLGKEEEGCTRVSLKVYGSVGLESILQT